MSANLGRVLLGGMALLSLLAVQPSYLLAQHTSFPAFEVVEVARFGGIDGPAALTTISDLIPSKDGTRLYVAQPQEGRIRILNADDGRPIATFGRAGSGPGEFKDILRLGWMQNTLYAVDWVQQRVVFFSNDGVHLDTERIASSSPLPQTRRPAVVFALTPEGKVIGRSSIPLIPAAEGRIVREPITLLARSGQLEKVLVELNLEGAYYTTTVLDRVGVFKMPYTTDVVGVARDGSDLVAVHQWPPSKREGSFDVVRITSSGDTVYSRRYPYSPVPVSPHLRDSVFNQIADAHIRGTGADRAVARRFAERIMRIPEAQPPVFDVLVNHDGSAWLQREVAAGGSKWMMISGDGRETGIVSVPSGLRILHVAGPIIWGVRLGQLDEPYVVKARLKSARE